MTATTTVPSHAPTVGHRSIWGRIGLVLAGAAVGIGATLVVADDDAPTAIERTASSTSAARFAGGSGALVSADAAERWSLNAVAGEVHRSADAAERWATSTDERQVETCTSGAISADAAERCLSNG